MYRRLTPRDKFLAIGSDGLWEKMTPNQVVRLVGEHIKGKSKDKNAATHLIRNALGGTTYDLDHIKLSQSLSLPKDMVRMQRDDITIQVVFFDEEYLRKC